jgi:hypothetical protein
MWCAAPARAPGVTRSGPSRARDCRYPTRGSRCRTRRWTARRRGGRRPWRASGDRRRAERPRLRCDRPDAGRHRGLEPREPTSTTARPASELPAAARRPPSAAYKRTQPGGEPLRVAQTLLRAGGSGAERRWQAVVRQVQALAGERVAPSSVCRRRTRSRRRARASPPPSAQTYRTTNSVQACAGR